MSKFKVIKVTTKTGLCLQDYGADIEDNFMVSDTRDKCLNGIRADLKKLLLDDSKYELMLNGFDISHEYELDELIDILWDAKAFGHFDEQKTIEWFESKLPDDDDKKRPWLIEKLIDNIDFESNPARIVVRIEEDDLYSTVSEITYQLFEI